VGEIEVRIHRPPWANHIQIGFFIKEGGKLLMAKPIDLSFEEVPEGVYLDPTLTIEGETGHQMLNELATALQKAGYESERTDSYKAELGATKRHLEDMRSLVFKDSVGE
jgi:hypothetical protein